jgi:hypothetical protein
MSKPKIIVIGAILVCLLMGFFLYQATANAAMGREPAAAGLVLRAPKHPRLRVAKGRLGRRRLGKKNHKKAGLKRRLHGARRSRKLNKTNRAGGMPNFVLPNRVPTLHSQ